jgi:hypothetical protein
MISCMILYMISNNHSLKEPISHISTWQCKACVMVMPLVLHVLSAAGALYFASPLPAANPAKPPIIVVRRAAAHGTPLALQPLRHCPVNVVVPVEGVCCFLSFPAAATPWIRFLDSESSHYLGGLSVP